MTQKTSLDPVILGSARTPTGKFLGGLSGLSAAELNRTFCRNT